MSIALVQGKGLNPLAVPKGRGCRLSLGQVLPLFSWRLIFQAFALAGAAEHSQDKTIDIATGCFIADRTFVKKLSPTSPWHPWLNESDSGPMQCESLLYLLNDCDAQRSLGKLFLDIREAEWVTCYSFHKPFSQFSNSVQMSLPITHSGPLPPSISPPLRHWQTNTVAVKNILTQSNNMIQNIHHPAVMCKTHEALRGTPCWLLLLIPGKSQGRGVATQKRTRKAG